MAVLTRSSRRSRQSRQVEDSMSPTAELKKSQHSSDTDEESEAGSEEPPAKQVSARARRRTTKEFSVIRWRARGYKLGQAVPRRQEFNSSLHTIQLDPATLVVSDLTDPEVKRVLHRTTTFYWPTFRVYLRDHNASVVDSWLEHTTGHSVLYHAMLRGQAIMMMSNNPNCNWDHAFPFIVYLGLYIGTSAKLWADQKLQRKHTLAASKEMRRMAEGREYATDEMIHAAMYLSMTARPRCSRLGREGGVGFGLFTPPLQKLQALDSHVETYWVDPHTSAVRAMVKQRGGLDQLQMFGLPESVLSYDIHIAAQNFEMPELGFSNAAEDFMQSVMKPEREAWKLEIETKNDRFSFDSLELPGELVNALRDMRVYSRHVQAFLTGDPAPPQVVLALQRNIIMHHVLTLPMYETDEELIGLKAWSVKMPTLVYVATSLYCYGVIYPTLRWHPKQICLDLLHRQLRILVGKHGLDCLESRHARLLLWVCMVGCMMAAGPNIYTAVDVAEDVAMVERRQDFYLRILAWCRIRLALESFAEVKEELEGWMWMEEACDNGGETVWDMLVGDSPNIATDSHIDLSP